LLEGPVELALERLRQRLIVIGIDALAIGREHGIEEAQEELGVGIVVRGDRLLVGVDLPEQKRLDEAPSRDQRMAVVERRAQRKRLQHVAFDVDVALQVSLGDVALVERAQRPHRPRVSQADVKLGVALADVPLLPIRQLDGEGRRGPADAGDEGVERRCGRWHSHDPGFMRPSGFRPQAWFSR
jgi:hypothetical protein